MAPRVGFVGLGWIGSARLCALAESGRVSVSALCEPESDRLRDEASRYSGAACFSRLDDLLHASDSIGLDGVVIATPNLFHASQSIACLEAGLSVFCQKPLSLKLRDAERVVETARRTDRLLDVDYAYRHTASARKLRDLFRDGDLGRIFGFDAAFHNAYGPDKAWCYDRLLSGGGAFIDLGVHLVDLLFWLLDSPRCTNLRADLYYNGVSRKSDSEIEDYADVMLDTENGPRARIAASFRAHVGRDCLFRVSLLGSEGGALFKNSGGSFYDFELWLFRGRDRRVLVREGGESLASATLDWARRLSESARYDPAVETSLATAEVVDRVYRGNVS